MSESHYRKTVSKMLVVAVIEGRSTLIHQARDSCCNRNYDDDELLLGGGGCEKKFRVLFATKIRDTRTRI